MDKSQACSGSKRKDEFLAMLAHELRNPLAPIRNGLQVLRRAAGQTGVAERVQDMMGRQVDHLVRPVDDLLEVSRITHGRIELKKERVALAAVVGHAVDMSRDLVDANELQLRVALPGDPLLLDGDPVRLAQVFSNLLNNAAKFTDRGGLIGMPVMDGFETARCLRQQQGGRKATLVALTGWGEEETRRRVKEAGFNRHLTKPADLEQVEALLKAASRNEKSFVVASGRSFCYDDRVRG